MTATNSYFQLAGCFLINNLIYEMLEKNNARPSSPVPKFMSLNVLIFPFDEMQHDVTKWASGRACQHLNWWSCCGKKPWGLMKCSRGRLQKGGGSSVDTPIGRKVKDERKCRGGQIYSTACAPTRAMCTQRKAPWCFPRTIIPLSDTTGIRNDSECTSTLPPHFFCLFLSFSPSHSLSHWIVIALNFQPRVVCVV